MERAIPKTMASQHPDNASVPAWCSNQIIAGEDEVKEAYMAFKEYGCQEVMWDSEGKDIDPHVVRKLLSSYPEFFGEKMLGRDIFLTFRVPNPLIEEAERKVFLESLQSIPRHNDIARLFYGDNRHFIFEIILPFTSSQNDIIRVKEVYRRAVVEPLSSLIDFKGYTLRDLIGDVSPKDIEVIPLVEDMDSILSIDLILTKYVELITPSYVRLFIARSDPALSYGFISATLLAKLGLSKARQVEETLGIPIYPIIGAGCLPFRGHNSPLNTDKFLEEYSGVYTVTIQSAFRYDFSLNDSIKAVEQLNSQLPAREADILDRDIEELATTCISKLMNIYSESLQLSAKEVNKKSRLIPSRRSRKLHIGLFSYSRKFRGFELPRAIPYSGFFYTLGLPPEFIGLRGLRALSEEEFDTVLWLHRNLKHDLSFSARFVSWENLSLLAEVGSEVERVFGQEFLKGFIPKYMEDIAASEEMLGIKCGPKVPSDRKYVNTVENFLISLIEGDEEQAKAELLSSARMRRSLG
ncbi:MAG: phosphoenolpyruvate carboxylase [Nitrososphaerota archaeon]